MSAEPNSGKKTRVLVVDDSPFMRRAISRILTAMPGIEVAGEAANGVEGVKQVLALRPDLVTMDVEMPEMDGVSAVVEIMKSVPTPIVMVSTLTSRGAETTIRALEAGAVEYIAKPSGRSAEMSDVEAQLKQAVERARHARPVRAPRRARPAPPPVQTATPRTPNTAPSPGIVLIGSSTGGPPALTEVISRLPSNLNAGVVIVQHMPPGFTAALARRLDSLTALSVTEAEDGDVVAAGRCLIAPGGKHLEIGDDRRIRLTNGPNVHGVKPAVDIALASMAPIYRRQATVAILTGMGRDGAAGCGTAETAGATIIVQDEQSSVVYGMPRTAKEATTNAIEAPIEDIADAIALATRRAARR